MNKEKEDFNFISIDILRGFAASTVFLYHYGLNKILTDKFHTSLFSFIDFVGSRYAVPLFFLISGFCIHLSQLKQNHLNQEIGLNLKKYFQRRFWRIYPTYLIILLFSCAVSAMLGEKISIADFFTHVFVLQGFSSAYFNTINLVLWTITIEICFYLLYPVWYWICSKRNINQALGFSLFISAMSWMILSLKFDPSSLPIYFFALNLWVSWCFGAWICEKIIIDKIDFAKNIYWWFIGLILIIAYNFLDNYSFQGFIKYNPCIMLWAWVLILFIKAELLLTKIKNSKFKYLIIVPISIGISSYSLYMLHMPLTYLRNIIILDVIQPNMRIAIGFVWLILTFVISWFSFQLFEKPFLTYWSKKR